MIVLILVSYQNAFANDDHYLPHTELSESCTSTITFENIGCTTTEVFLNYYGNYYHYKTLHPSEQYQQHTYEHYLWEVYIVVDGDYVYITSYTAGCEDAHVTINSGGGNIHVDAGQDQTICPGGSVQLCATGADHYQWSTGENTQCINVSPNGDVTYSVTGSSNGCTDTDHVDVWVSDNIHVDAGQDQTICPGGSVQLCATGADHYQWSTGENTQCINVSPNGDVTYSVTGSSNGCTDTDHVDVWVSDNIHVDAGEDKTICKGESVQICATGADHYEWSNGHTGECINVSPGSDKNYSVTGTTNGCTDTDHVSVHVNRAKWDDVSKGSDTGCGSTCDGSIIVNASNATGDYTVQYTFDGNTVTEGPFTISGDVTLDHLCTGTYSNITVIGVDTGCTDVWSHDITIQGGGNIHVDAGEDKTICKGESVQICATGADHYEWSNGHTGECINVSPNSDKNYTVTGTTNGCTDTDHVSVHVNNAKWDHVNKGNDTGCGNTCDGSIVVDANYNATGEFRIQYTYDGNTVTEGPFTVSGDITLDHLCAGTYSNITIIGVHTGCKDVWPDDITIQSGGNIHVDAGDDKTICKGESIQICATGADHYEWSNGHTGACITASPNSDKNYTVTGTTDGCTDTDHVSVHVNNAKWKDVSKGNDTGCGDTCNGSIIVDAKNVTGEFKVQYTYNGNTVTEGPFAISGDITLDHLCAGTYSDITVIGVNTGCKDVWPHDITIQGGDNIHVDAGDDKTICKGESIQICATGADHYEWSNGHTGECITVSPGNDRNYSVTGTTNGCTDTDHVSVHVNEAKWNSIVKNKDASCGACDGSISVDVDYDVTGEFIVEYTYNGEDVTEGPYTDSSITLNHVCAGTYANITITGVHTGCKDVWSHDIIIQGGDNIHVDAGDDKTICRGESVQICATGADHYEWSNGHTGACITVSPNNDKNYSVTGTTNGCTDTDHVSVHVNKAKWDHVSKGNDTGCDSCNGSIIVDANYNATGEFRVQYTFDGNTVTEGPFTASGDITLDHLCAGTYSNITIIGVHTGCKEVWSHDIIIENDCTQECKDYTLDFSDNGVNWHDNDTWNTYNLDGQEVEVDILDNDHILKLTREKNSGLEIGINPHDTHDEVVITYTLSEVSSHVLFDIVDLDYKTGGSKQQEAVCVYGLLGNDATHILPTITSIDGSVAIHGNCAEATANSSAGHDESILVEFTECIDQIVIVYGTGSNSPTSNPTYSNIIIGKNLGFTSEVCSDPCESGGSSREDSSVADINIFPNPATHTHITLSIETDVTGPADIVIIDGLGRVVSQSLIQLANTTSQHQLDVNRLTAGVYFVKVFTKEGQSKAKHLVILNR